MDFQRKVHARGLKLMLNTHDQCGVQSTQGPIHAAVARAVGQVSTPLALLASPGFSTTWPAPCSSCLKAERLLERVEYS